jgi:hypothetical protein
MRLPLLFSFASLLVSSGAVAGGSVTVASVKGEVTVRPPRATDYQRVSANQKIADRSRLRTGGDGQATLRFSDGSEAKVSPKTEIIVHAERTKEEPAGATLFFGRVWSKVVKAVGGESAFEVRSANAVAGVRGTEFEVGVADDGSARVIVREGLVAVEGEAGKPVQIARGYEVESDHRGKLAGQRKAPSNPDWDGWFSKRARKLERQGVEVAQELDGRLSRRWRQVEKLVREQRVLREQIEKLEARSKSGEDVEEQLESKLAALERVTERLVDMRARLEAAFGIFERWGSLAEQGAIANGEQVGSLAGNVARIAADFADMIEEGTDLSPEGMEEMMDDMKRGPTLRPKKKGAADELLE